MAPGHPESEKSKDMEPHLSSWTLLYRMAWQTAVSDALEGGADCAPHLSSLSQQRLDTPSGEAEPRTTEPDHMGHSASTLKLGPVTREHKGLCKGFRAPNPSILWHSFAQVCVCMHANVCLRREGGCWIQTQGTCSLVSTLPLRPTHYSTSRLSDK